MTIVTIAPAIQSIDNNVLSVFTMQSKSSSNCRGGRPVRWLRRFSFSNHVGCRAHLCHGRLFALLCFRHSFCVLTCLGHEDRACIWLPSRLFMTATRHTHHSISTMGKPDFVMCFVVHHLGLVNLCCAAPRSNIDVHGWSLSYTRSSGEICVCMPTNRCSPGVI